MVNISVFNLGSLEKVWGTASSPTVFTIDRPEQYQERLEEHYVITDFKKRKQRIEDQIQK